MVYCPPRWWDFHDSPRAVAESSFPGCLVKPLDPGFFQVINRVERVTELRRGIPTVLHTVRNEGEERRTILAFDQEPRDRVALRVKRDHVGWILLQIEQ